ncbi:hypothetical protein C3743_06375 [Burkholderia contaminans]|uniref:Uncharacterized protein n=2 Tax=Burkholderiaceae TaxID=119060 RepID=A0A2S5E481_9BURK|nr:hypothetical protein C3743_06375 [Burkholderia contaminans]
MRVRRRAPHRLRWPHPTPTETVMPHQCLAQRAAFTARSPSAANRPSSGPRNDRTAFATVTAWCLRIVGWYRLERLLASIPDSNDDFGLV